MGMIITSLRYNAMRSERVWPAEYISRLRLLGEIFVNAIIARRPGCRWMNGWRLHGFMLDSLPDL